MSPEACCYGSSNLLSRPQAGQRDCEALDVDRFGDVALPNIGQDVVMEGIRNMCCCTGEGALAGTLRL